MKKLYFLFAAVISFTPFVTLAQSIEFESDVYSFNIQANVESPTEYVNSYVRDSVSIWQLKGRYEPSVAYQVRVNATTREQLVKRLIDDAQQSYLNKYYVNKDFVFRIKAYDADNEAFLFTNSIVGDIILPVSLSEAERFEQGWIFDKSSVSLYIDGENVRAKELNFISNNKNYRYNDSQNATFALSKVNVDLPTLDIDLDKSGSISSKIVTNEITIAQSDVDVNIPVSRRENKKSFVLIIANENYKRVGSVPFAINDGRTFKTYCEKTLGIPEQNIRYVENATLNDISYAVNWITDVQKTQRGKARVIVYYAGHGIPDEKTMNSYILPIDGYPTDSSTAYSIDKLYSLIGGQPAESITYFIDACFSGAKRSGDMLASARGVALKAKEGRLLGNSVSFAASSEDQTAYPYNEKGHGLFTYYLLKKLQDSKGEVSYEDLSDYINERVSAQSVIINSKVQTPLVNCSSNIVKTWRNYTLK